MVATRVLTVIRACRQRAALRGAHKSGTSKRVRRFAGVNNVHLKRPCVEGRADAAGEGTTCRLAWRRQNVASHGGEASQPSSTHVPAVKSRSPAAAFQRLSASALARNHPSSKAWRCRSEPEFRWSALNEMRRESLARAGRKYDENAKPIPRQHDLSN